MCVQSQLERSPNPCSSACVLTFKAERPSCNSDIPKPSLDLRSRLSLSQILYTYFRPKVKTHLRKARKCALQILTLSQFRLSNWFKSTTLVISVLNFWNLLGGLLSHSVLNSEISYRFNHRKEPDLFLKVLRNVLLTDKQIA